MKIVKFFTDPDNTRYEWGLGLDGNLYYKYTHSYDTSIDIVLDGYVSYGSPIIPEWKPYNKHSRFGISIQTMKLILRNFGNLIAFA